jgi:hypothetical protein
MKDLVGLAGLTFIVGAAGSAATLNAEAVAHPTKSVVVEAAAAEGNGTLFVRCASGEATVFLKWRDYRGSGPILIKAQLDGAAPLLGWWPKAVGKREVQYSGDQAWLIRGLRVSKTLVVKLSPEAVFSADAGVDGNIDNPPQTVAGILPLQMTFKLSDLAAALANAQGTCGPT